MLGSRNGTDRLFDCRDRHASRTSESGLCACAVPRCVRDRADTVVDLDGTILGKPASPADAIATLKRMQGRSHVVYTGVAVLKKDYADLRYAMTKVAFRPMTDTEIEWYVSTGEPLDKAGSYGVQGLASVFVERIEGDYFNVIGLPASLLYEMLLKAGAVTEDRK